MKSEESIFQEASKKIKELSELHSGQSKFKDNVLINDIEIAIADNEKPLQDQVKIGEITPFQAIEKHKIKSQEGYIKLLYQ